MSRLSELYTTTYEAICGRHPSLRPWHFQWLATKDLYPDLKRILPSFKGSVIDVGCGDMPYRRWMSSNGIHYLGIDTHEGSGIDMVIRPREEWSIQSNSIDAAMCTQVLEHAADFDHTIKEIERVLKPGGLLLVTVPFIYNVHGRGTSGDYRRFTLDGLSLEFERSFEVIELKPQGGIGSSVGILMLNWIETVTTDSAPMRVLKGLLLPLWLGTCTVVNLLGWVLDKLDHTDSFYNNVLLLASKRTR